MQEPHHFVFGRTPIAADQSNSAHCFSVPPGAPPVVHPLPEGEDVDALWTQWDWRGNPASVARSTSGQRPFCLPHFLYPPVRAG